MHDISLQLPEDELSGDNQLWAAVPVKDSLLIRLVDGEPSSEPFGSEVDYLAAPLSIGVGDAEAWRIEVVQEENFLNPRLEVADVLILANEARDGPTWAVEFARFSALSGVVRDDGSGLGKGLKLERARRRAAGQPDLEDSLDIFHTFREGGRALRTTWGAASRALERAEAAQKELDRLGRAGESRTGHATRTSRLWRQAEGLWDQALAAERAWKLSRSAFEFFTPEGRFNDRQQAQAVVAAALPHLSGPAWAKTRRLLRRRESFTFLDQAATASGRAGIEPRRLVGLAGPGRLAAPSLATVEVNARLSRDTGLGVGPHGPTVEGRTPLAGFSWAGS